MFMSSCFGRAAAGQSLLPPLCDLAFNSTIRFRPDGLIVSLESNNATNFDSFFTPL